jgi:hypothetical protein
MICFHPTDANRRYIASGLVGSFVRDGRQLPEELRHGLWLYYNYTDPISVQDGGRKRITVYVWRFKRLTSQTKQSGKSRRQTGSCILKPPR